MLRSRDDKLSLSMTNGIEDQLGVFSVCRVVNPAHQHTEMGREDLSAVMSVCLFVCLSVCYMFVYQHVAARLLRWLPVPALSAVWLQRPAGHS